MVRLKMQKLKKKPAFQKIKIFLQRFNQKTTKKLKKMIWWDKKTVYKKLWKLWNRPRRNRTKRW